MWNSIIYYEKTYFGKNKEKSSLPLFKAWGAGKGITRFMPCGHGLDWHRTLETGRRTYSHEYYIYHNNSPEALNPPYLDHGILFKASQTEESEFPKIWLTYHPYYPYNRREEVEPVVQSWAAAHGLHATVLDTSQSWYYPGETCTVIVEISEVQNAE